MLRWEWGTIYLVIHQESGKLAKALEKWLEKLEECRKINLFSEWNLSGVLEFCECLCEGSRNQSWELKRGTLWSNYWETFKVSFLLLDWWRVFYVDCRQERFFLAHMYSRFSVCCGFIFGFRSLEVFVHLQLKISFHSSTKYYYFLELMWN